MMSSSNDRSPPSSGGDGDGLVVGPNAKSVAHFCRIHCEQYCNADDHTNQTCKVICPKTSMSCLDDDYKVVLGFHAPVAPQMTIYKYIHRICQHTETSDESFIIALVYIDRIINLTPKFQLNYHTVHRILLVTLLVASKFHDDLYNSNEWFARVGGVTLEEINRLEILFINRLEFNCMVTRKEFQTFINAIEKTTHVY